MTTCDHVDDQSLGRSCGLFPGSRALGSRDTQGVEVSHDITRDMSGDITRDMSGDITRDMSGDTFPGSHGRGVVLTT